MAGCPEAFELDETPAQAESKAKLLATTAREIGRSLDIQHMRSIIGIHSKLVERTASHVHPCGRRCTSVTTLARGDGAGRRDSEQTLDGRLDDN